MNSWTMPVALKSPSKESNRSYPFLRKPVGGVLRCSYRLVCLDRALSELSSRAELSAIVTLIVFWEEHTEVVVGFLGPDSIIFEYWRGVLYRLRQPRPRCWALLLRDISGPIRDHMRKSTAFTILSWHLHNFRILFASLQFQWHPRGRVRSWWPKLSSH